MVPRGTKVPPSEWRGCTAQDLWPFAGGLRAATILGMTIEVAFGLWLIGTVVAIAAAAYLAAQLLPHSLIKD